MMASVFETGEAVWIEASQFSVERKGFLEEAYFTFSYTPARDESGSVAGIFETVAEVTPQVLAHRRLALLRELSEHDDQRVEDVCRSVAGTLGRHAQDVPFALIYLLETSASSDTAVLRGLVGMEAGTPGSPSPVVLDSTDDRWRLGKALRTAGPVEVRELGESFGALPGRPWPEPAHTAIVIPIERPGSRYPFGFFVAGISPRLPLDDSYTEFLRLASQSISRLFSTADAYTQERDRAEALAALDHAKTAFFSNVSHEFRTPLTLLLGPVEDALGRPSRSLEGLDLEVVHRSAIRLLRLVNSLLDFARIEAGRQELSFAPTDISSSTSELASAFRSLVENAGLNLKVDCPPLSEQAFVNRVSWEKIVLNLISNAFKFTFDGEIEVSLRSSEGQIELTVRDTGVGIPAHELPHVFERFHRVDGAKGRSFEGTGIGLSLVRELAKLHGGGVSATSTEGEGSAFRVWNPRGSAHLPEERVERRGATESGASGPMPYLLEASQWIDSNAPLPASEIPPPNATPQPSPGLVSRSDDQRAHVLVVNDNADMRGYLARLLSTRWSVETASDGEAALACVKRRRPDLVLSDVMMPKLDGLSLLRELRADTETQEIPIVLLSARAGEDALLEGFETGADDYLVKPFSARELLARVETHVTMARLRREWAIEREEAARVNLAKSNFLRLVSHEFRTPLAALTLQVGRLARGRELQASERQREIVARMTTTTTRLNELVESLLAYTRIESGHWDPKLETFDAVRVAHEVVSELNQEIRQKPLILSTNPKSEGHLEVTSDPHLVRLVLTNLVGNAIKFTEQGRINVSVTRGGHRVRFAVRDTGPGIPAEEHARIFKPFEQLERLESKHLQGFGLGLALVKEMVSVLNGQIELFSEVGAGSTFVVSLPVAPEVQAS